MTPEQDGGAAEGESTATERERRERRAILDQMTAEAEELGLYDDPPPDDRAALRDARRGRSRGAPDST